MRGLSGSRHLRDSEERMNVPVVGCRSIIAIEAKVNSALTLLLCIHLKVVE
jgi:hypothetical protein